MVTFTVSMTVNYLEPAREALIGEGRAVRAGRSLTSVEAMVITSRAAPWCMRSGGCTSSRGGLERVT